MNSDARSGHSPLIPGSMVSDSAGQQAQVTASEQAGDSRDITVQLASGKTLHVPSSLLAVDNDGSYRLPFSFAALEETTPLVGTDTGREPHVIPVIREELQVSKRVVDTGRGIRVHQHIVEREEVVDEPLYEDAWETTRVPIGKVVSADALPMPRQDGDTFIVPVLEEVLVVEKRLRLKEELHITRHKREIHAPQTVVLKSLQVHIERFEEKREMGGTTT